jgi:hypothetical protein
MMKVSEVKKLDPLKTAWDKFREHAASRGYTHKVVGDFAFDKGYDGEQVSVIRMKRASSTTGKVTVYETGKGTYEI